MDVDDDPLLGHRLETSASFGLRQSHATPQPHNDVTAFEKRVLGAAAMRLLDDFVEPVDESIGAQLLNQMGWKQGHGIGPRVRRKRIEDPVAATIADHDNADEADVVYVPPRTVIDASAFPAPKLDMYGAGFDPYVNAPEFSHYKQRQASALAQKQQARQVVTFADAMKATSGSYETVTGFGLSALEDNDDLDVYGTAPLSAFDTVLGGTRLRLSSGNDDVKLLEAGERRRPPTFGSDGRPALPGFEYAYAKEMAPKALALRLNVPADFNPHHRSSRRGGSETDSVPLLYRQHNFTLSDQGRPRGLTVRQRAALLGEPAERESSVTASKERSGSVFELLGAEQKAKLAAAIAAANKRQHQSDRDRQAIGTQQERQPLVQGVAGSQFRANISASIAKRFVSASSTEPAESEPAAPGAKKPSYRSESAWTPSSLLCKRFHVKCLTGAVSGQQLADEKRDLFDSELVPHLVEFAAERRSSQAARASKGDTDALGSSRNSTLASSSSSSRSTSRFAKREDAKAEDDGGNDALLSLSPLPPVPKPTASLLKAIFEPSDESDMDEDDGSDTDDSTPDGSGDESVARERTTESVTGNTDVERHRDSVVTVSKQSERNRDRAVSDASSASSVSATASVARDEKEAVTAPTALTRRGRDASTADIERTKLRKNAKSAKKKHKKEHKKERKHRHRSSRSKDDDDDSSNDSRKDDDDGDDDASRKHHRKKHKESRKKKSHKRSDSVERLRSHKRRRT